MACYTIQLSKHKSFECQINLFDKMSEDYIFCLNGHWSIRSDHAGPSLMIIIWKVIYFSIQIRDHRRWNYDDDRWYSDEENQFPDFKRYRYDPDDDSRCFQSNHD